MEMSPGASPSNSGNDLSSEKSSMPRFEDSTGVTLLQVKSPTSSKCTSLTSSEVKKTLVVSGGVDEGSNKEQLMPIAELENLEEADHDHIPS